MVDAEQQALKKGKNRKEAIYAAYARFYTGDIAKEFVRGCKEQGGLITEEDLARWKVQIEEPVSVNYKGIEVYKLSQWTQGPAMLQALNILENFDLKSMGYNSARYIHTVTQAMHLSFADRDFYYGDPAFAPQEPMKGLLSKEYAKERAKLIDPAKNLWPALPGDPYPFEGKSNPFTHYLRLWNNDKPLAYSPVDEKYLDQFWRGTTSVEAADSAGWVVSVTPSGGWLPACIAGKTGVGMSQRMQSFVLEEKDNPFNVLTPGKRPRVTLSPGTALRRGWPLLCFAMQGGDMQDQHLLQMFLNIVEFGMPVQDACEAAYFTSYQMRASFDKHDSKPGRITLQEDVAPWVRRDLMRMGYKLDLKKSTSGPLSGIFFDPEHGTLWGGCSDDGDDHGIAW
jgi:gamma-glutamyltranspeptidase/glutathione hydrolase